MIHTEKYYMWCFDFPHGELMIYRISDIRSYYHQTEVLL